MTNDPFASVSGQIMQSMFEPILIAFIEKLKADGWRVEMSRHGESGFMIVFGKPDQPQSTATGENAKEALDDLIRNLTQLGELPKELREMQHRLEQQVSPIRNAVSDQLEHDLKLAIGKFEE